MKRMLTMILMICATLNMTAQSTCNEKIQNPMLPKEWMEKID